MFIHRKAQSEEVLALKKQLMECDLAAGEQKKRILALREENAALRAELNEYIAKSSAVADALINAQRMADAIRARAETQSREILKTAADRCAAEEARLAELHRQLRLLRESCARILAAVSEETERPISLKLASGCD